MRCGLPALWPSAWVRAAFSRRPDAPTLTAVTSPVRLRAALDAVPAYRAGRPAPPGAYKISSNENPYPPLPSVPLRCSRTRRERQPLPGLRVQALVGALAERFDVPPDCTRGGHRLGRGAAAGRAERGRSRRRGGVRVALVRGLSDRHPGRRRDRRPGAAAPRRAPRPDAMAAAVTPRTRLVLVCSPNNPTGTSVAADELDRVARRRPVGRPGHRGRGVPRVRPDPDVPDGLESVRGPAQRGVLRTFSKAYGLAGLRVGFAVAHPPVSRGAAQDRGPVRRLRARRGRGGGVPGGRGELLERVDALVAERARVLAALRGQGWSVPASQANFVWLRLGERDGRDRGGVRGRRGRRTSLRRRGHPGDCRRAWCLGPLPVRCRPLRPRLTAEITGPGSEVRLRAARPPWSRCSSCDRSR